MRWCLLLLGWSCAVFPGERVDQLRARATVEQRERVAVSIRAEGRVVEGGRRLSADENNVFDQHTIDQVQHERLLAVDRIVVPLVHCV